MTREEKVALLTECIREARSIEELADMLTERGLEMPEAGNVRASRCAASAQFSPAERIESAVSPVASVENWSGVTNGSEDKVIKALECCGDDQRCYGCPYTEESECYTKMSRDAHDIVVRQRVEIARLTKLCELRDRDNKDTTELLIEAEEQIKKLKIAMQMLSTQKKRP